MARAKMPPTPPVSPRDTFFDLSSRGALPDLLREIATRLEAQEVTAEQFDWSLSKETLEFKARIDMRRGG
jgi:hypothetical protein